MDVRRFPPSAGHVTSALVGFAALTIPFSANRMLVDRSAGASFWFAASVLGLALYVTGSAPPSTPRGAPARRIALACGMYAAWIGLSTLWSQTPVVSFRAAQPAILMGLMVGLSSRLPPLDHDRIVHVLRAITALAVLMSIHAVLQFFGADPLGGTSYEGLRGQSVMRHPNVLAGHLVVMIPLALVAFRSGQHGTLSKLSVPLLLVLLIGLATTLSRAGLMAIFVVGALLFASRRVLAAPATRRKHKWAWALGLVFASFIGAVAFHAIRSPDWARFSTPAGLSGNTRVLQWEGALSMLSATPVLGQGYGTYPLALPSYQSPALTALYSSGSIFIDDASGEYAQLAAEAGVPGLILLVALIGVTMMAQFRFVRDPEATTECRTMATVLLGSTVGLVVHATVQSSLRYGPLWFDFALLLWLTLNHASQTHPASDRSSESSPSRRWTRTIAAIASLCALVVLLDSGRRCLSIAHYKRARAELRQGRDDRANALLERALGVDSHNIEARYRRGAALYGLGRYQNAYGEYLRVHETAPHFLNVSFNLAVCAARDDQLDVARKWIELSTEFNPNRMESQGLREWLDGGS